MAKEEKGTGAETAAEPAVPVHETIEHWYNVHGTGPAVYAGTLCLMGWRPGKQVTVAHLIAHPAPEICEKAGIPDVDAIGILTLTPGETAIIAGDMAVRSADVNVAFLDRFSGTLILYGSVGAVEQALTQVNDMLKRLLQFTICPVTRH